MDGVVGRGTVLAGRYQLTEPRPCTLPGTSEWDATDQILARPVVVRVIPTAGAGPALDAARRAALVTDPRLVRVLDVGSDGDAGYVVSEQVNGPTLAQLVAREPLSADQARAVVGEAAAALEVARRRGVHHLALRPSALAVADDGRVLVSGLALDATLLNRRVGDARTTSRTDAADLVRLVYTALTGHWPGPLASSDGLPTAPETDGVPVPPGDLVPGVPADLNTLCRVTLGREDDGPLSPADLVRELEPWGEIRVQGRPRRTLPPLPPPVTTAPGQVVRQSVRSSFGGSTATATPLGTPPSAAPERSGGSPAPASGSPGRLPGTVPMTPVPTDDVATPVTGVPSVVPAPPAASVPPAVAAPGAAAFTGPAVPGGAPLTGSLPPGRLPPAVPPPGPLSAGPGAPGGPFDSAQYPGPPPDPFDFGQVEEPAPRRPWTTAVMVLVGLLVLVGIGFAVTALFSGTGAGGGVGAAATTSAQAPAGSTGPSAPASSSAPGASPSSTARLGAPPMISGIASVNPADPTGEHAEAVARAIDGDPTTFWYSMTYQTANLGGLKPGTGLALTLAGQASVHTVTLHVNGTGGNVEVRATDAGAPTQGPVLASGPLSQDTVLTLTPTPTTSSLVLWFTELPTTADGSFRVELTEIELG